MSSFRSTNMRRVVHTRSITIGLAVVLFGLAAAASIPEGWRLAGDQPWNYEVGIDPQTRFKDLPSSYLRSMEPQISGFGTLMQNLKADEYLGKRIRFSAAVKGEKVNNWAGMWMRVDKGMKYLAFDNMQNRPIRGDSAWHEYSIVLDVPTEATGIACGILLNGTGQVWMSNVKMEAVGKNVPTTNLVTGIHDLR